MKGEEPKTKKIKTIEVTYMVLEQIIRNANNDNLNFMIEDVFEVDSKRFIDLLKEISDIGIV